MALQILVLICAGCGVFVLLWNSWSKRRLALKGIAMHVAGRADHRRRQVHGQLNAIPVSLRINKTGGQPFTTPSWSTRLTARVPPAARLQLAVSRAPAWDQPIRLPTGDDSFDAAFAVTGAPSDVVPFVFTPELRQRFIDFNPGAEWRLVLEAGQVVLEVDDPLWNVRQAAPALELIAVLAAAVPAAEPAADAAVRARMQVTPYRGAVVQGDLKAVQQARAEELLLADQRRAEQRNYTVWLAVCAGLLGLFALYASMR